MQITELCLRCDGVYLAHVASAILLLDVVDVEEPCAMLVVFIVCHTDAWVPGDHVIVYGQYCRLLVVDPRHLRKRNERGDEKVR